MQKSGAEFSDSGVRQLLGVRGGTRTSDKWALRLQLTKPITWIPLVWGVVCGAAASGNYHAIWDGATFDQWGMDLVKALACTLLAGPLLTGYTQTLNDLCDRDIDAINEPDRPIPSGAISEGEVVEQIWFLLLASLGLALSLDAWAGHATPVIFGMSVLGSFIGYLYSAPPLKLKRVGWMGNYALGMSYMALPWWCGQCFFNAASFSWQTVALTLAYSVAGFGIAIVNDFKSMEGDRKLGIKSLPAQFGADAAKWICVAVIDATQLGIAAFLAYIGEAHYAAALAALILPQAYLQSVTLLQDPVANDVKYQATAQPFLVLGMLAAALAWGHHLM